MKKRVFIYLFVCLLTAITSCEKPVYDEKGDKSENTNNGNNGGDNGGWANDPNNNGDGTDWQYSDTLTVGQFCQAQTGQAVWVRGIIVGCATGSGGYSYQTEPTFTYETALLLADNAESGTDGEIMAVQLQSGSKIRKELNLADHPENYKKTVVIYGEKTTYLKLPGIKTIFAYGIK